MESYAAGATATPMLDETIGANLDRTTARWGDREALVECATGRRWTYRQLQADVDACALADLLDGGLHVAVEEELAAFDDADLVADIRELGQNVARQHDRLAHVAQLFDEAAHLDAGAWVEAARGFIEQ